jgi:ubiquinone/menaquinone biosynthesis C-methylase UbiE
LRAPARVIQEDQQIGNEQSAHEQTQHRTFLGPGGALRHVEGSAEATTLPARSIDCIVAAQAFHWFDRPECRREFQRILKPGGWVVLIWNSRRLSTPFLRAYESLLQQFGTDYQQVDHKNIEPAVLNQFSAPGWKSRVTGNEQTFDLESLKGRLLSSSYAPAEGHSNHAPMLLALERIFREHQENGRVRFEYDTEIHFGRIGG